MKKMDLSKPLAYRMRPTTLDEYVGQEHILGKDKILYRTIKADRLSSIILFGPPGCGKTSLARVISETTKYKFYKINAVTSGVSDIKRVVEETKNMMLNPQGKSILFIDEIHRFNKLQQDALLPYVEDGTVILIGATTENPYFEVNKALISRSMVFKLNPLTKQDIIKVLKMSLEREDGLKSYDIKIEDSTIEKIADVANGDVRTALNGLEDAVYIQILVNQDNKRMVVRKCEENDKDALRWCVAKPDKRKSRKMTNKIFSAMMYEMMGWNLDCRYKILGHKITFEDETIYVFDLMETEIFLDIKGKRAKKDTESQTTIENANNIEETASSDTDTECSAEEIKRKNRIPFYPKEWKDSFGLPVEEHRKALEINMLDGYAEFTTGK